MIFSHASSFRINGEEKIQYDIYVRIENYVKIHQGTRRCGMQRFLRMGLFFRELILSYFQSKVFGKEEGSKSSLRFFVGVPF